MYPSDEINTMRKISSLVDSFPETGGDGSKIVWAHGTNTKETMLNAKEGKWNIKIHNTDSDSYIFFYKRIRLYPQTFKIN